MSTGRKDSLGGGMTASYFFFGECFCWHLCGRRARERQWAVCWCSDREPHGVEALWQNRETSMQPVGVVSPQWDPEARLPPLLCVSVHHKPGFPSLRLTAQTITVIVLFPNTLRAPELLRPCVTLQRLSHHYRREGDRNIKCNNTICF